MAKLIKRRNKFKIRKGEDGIAAIFSSPSNNLDTASSFSKWLGSTMFYLFNKPSKDIIESKYKPTLSKESNTTYYTIKGLDEDVVKNILGGSDYGKKDVLGQDLYYKNFDDVFSRLKNNRAERNTDNSQLGAYTIGTGVDDKGNRYISYYDKFDWAPTGVKDIFHPFEIYNRIYEKDFKSIQEKLKGVDYKGSNPSGKLFFKPGKEIYNYIK